MQLKLLLLLGLLCIVGESRPQDRLKSGPAILDGTMSSFSSAIKHGTFAANEEYELFSLYGDTPGHVTEQWYAGKDFVNDETRIRIYIDNETTPSLDFNLFMAHGIGCGHTVDDQYTPWQTSHFSREAVGNVYNTYKIPFQRSIRITVTIPYRGSLWYIVRGVRNLPLILNNIQLPSNARLRLYKVENTTLQPLQFVTAAQTTNISSGWLYQVSKLPGQDYGYLYLCNQLTCYLFSGMTTCLLFALIQAMVDCYSAINEICAF